MILVVGATGQLGTAVVRRLAGNETPVRAFVREDSDREGIDGLASVEFAYGDLRDGASIEAALEGVDTVVATANAVVPRSRGDGFRAVEDAGYRRLIEASVDADVDRFVLVSVPESPLEDRIPSLRYKRLNERRLEESGLDYTVVRAAPFMEVWLALLGSSIPEHGTEIRTLGRPFWFSRLFRRLTGRLIEKRGIALVPGSGETRHSFVTVGDTAAYVVGCLDDSETRNATVEVGGPEALSLDEVVDIYADVLGRRVRAVSLPTWSLRVLQAVLSPASPAAGNLMGLNRFVATTDTVYDPSEFERIVGESPTSVEAFLRERVDEPTRGEESSSRRRASASA